MRALKDDDIKIRIRRVLMGEGGSWGEIMEGIIEI